MWIENIWLIEAECHIYVSENWAITLWHVAWSHFYQTRSAWSVDQGSNKNHSPAYNFAPTVTKFCVMWEGLSLPHDTKFGNCRCKIVDSRAFPSWSLIHGLRWSGLIKAEPAREQVINPVLTAWRIVHWTIRNKFQWKLNQHTKFSVNKLCLKMSSANCRPCCSAPRVFINEINKTHNFQHRIHQSLLMAWCRWLFGHLRFGS